MVSQCAECKHWDKDSENQEWEARKSGFGKCNAIRTRWDIMDDASGGRRWAEGDEAKKALIEARIDALRAARAYVQDGSEYRAELFTGPDFFCALFFAKK
jgi:hypothetical protein